MSDRPDTSSIFLVGLMGAGKTTVGRLLAQQLGKTFVDADHEIEKRCGVKISYIFDVEGEEGFRRRETDILKELTQLPGIVLATGGGAVIRPENRELLMENGTVVYLSVSPIHLAQRMKNDQHRPLLQNRDIEALLKELHEVRDPWYREVADIILNSTRQAPKRIVSRLVHQLESNAHDHSDH